MESMAAGESLYLVSLLEIIQTYCAHLVLETIPAHITDSCSLDIGYLLKGEASVFTLIEKLIWLRIWNRYYAILINKHLLLSLL